MSVPAPGAARDQGECSSNPKKNAFILTIINIQAYIVTIYIYMII